MKTFLIALSILFSVSAFAEGADDAIATVNGKKITRAEFENYHQQNLRFVSDRKVTREVSLYDLINRELSIQKAKKANLQNDPNVASKLDDILFHAQVSKDLEGELKKITVSDDEVKKYYNENKEYRSAHILYRLPAVPKPEEVKTAYTQSLGIYDEVTKNPDTFATLANKYSQSSAAPIGGDLGFQPPTRLPVEYYEAIKGQKTGFISKPIRSQLGFHIIKVLGVKDFDQIDKNVYKKIIYDSKVQVATQAYYKEQQKKADIKINKQLL